MKISFRLIWPSKSTQWGKAFKSKEASLLFQDYFARIQHFVPCTVQCLVDIKRLPERSPRLQMWICERNEKKSNSSEEIATRLTNLMNSGVSDLQIVVGGSDGISREEIQILKPDFMWSFGALTLPHELAAVVAGEQIYRAFTIIKNLPYHSGH